MSDPLTCSICTGELSINNVVNTECKHPTCKTCFWRWAKDKNTCPFCREHLLKNNEEAKDIQRMRELLNHKSNIIRQVEEAYEEEEGLLQSIGKKYKELGEIKLKAHYVEIKLIKLEKSQGGKYQTYKYFKTLMEEKKRKNRFGVNDEQVFSNYKEVVSDIKSLSKHSPSFQFRHLLPQDLAYRLFFHVRCMERKRKERRKRKAYNDNINEEPLALDTLFSQEEECITESGSDMDMDLAYIQESQNGILQDMIANDPQGESLIDDPDIISELDEISNWTPSNWRPHIITPPQTPRIGGIPPSLPRRPIRTNLINSLDGHWAETAISREIFRDMVMQVIQEENQLSNVD